MSSPIVVVQTTNSFFVKVHVGLIKENDWEGLGGNGSCNRWIGMLLYRSVGKDEVELTTQKDLYAFLQSRITQMKEENVSRQIAALTVMDKK